MLCRTCHCQLAPDADYCGACGAPRGGAARALELVLADGTRVALTETVTIGRGPQNGIRLGDGTVSRTHARVTVSGAGAVIEDAGSSHGTWLDGARVDAPTPLRAGDRIRVGDVELGVDMPRDEAAPGRTVVVPLGASLVLPADGPASMAALPAAPHLRPRARRGWALKRLDAGEGARRYILRDLDGGDFVRMSDADAHLFMLLDGTRTVPELVAAAEEQEGPAGPGRLARLFADLGERGLLDGVDADAAPVPVSGRLGRLMRPRVLQVRGAGDRLARLYRLGGWVLFTGAARVVLAAIAVGGIGVFTYLIAARYGTPFVVASKLGLGGVIFLLGRFAVALFHEMAHGLALTSFGRRVERAGLKLLVIFPYAFVDTSQAWFEPRRRRIAVSAAGPASDLVLGGAFASVCLALGAGSARDVFFQLALAAYVGAFFNLNPLVDRDGYQILVDALREPGLRRRSRAQLQRILAGGPRRADDSPVLLRYAVAAVVWSVAAALFAIVLSTRYYETLRALAPDGLVWATLAALYLMLFVPVLFTLARPLWERSNRLPTEVRRVSI